VQYDELTMRGVKAASGVATVPQIFIDGMLIGGADQQIQATLIATVLGPADQILSSSI
jgi:glutaredoxin-related protein